MKRILAFLLFAAAFFLNPGKSLAQCSENGANFDCYSYSQNSNTDTDTETWATEGTWFWVTVNLQANHPADGYAYAEVTTANDYYVNMVTNRDSFQDGFYLSGNSGGSLMLYASARYGSAYVTASW
jgi:hypothetical protein